MQPDLRPHCVPAAELAALLQASKPAKSECWALHRGGEVTVHQWEDGRSLLELTGVKAMMPELRLELAEILTRCGVTVAGYTKAEPEPDVLGEEAMRTDEELAEPDQVKALLETGGGPR